MIPSSDSTMDPHTIGSAFISIGDDRHFSPIRQTYLTAYVVSTALVFSRRSAHVKFTIAYVPSALQRRLERPPWPSASHLEAEVPPDDWVPMTKVLASILATGLFWLADRRYPNPVGVGGASW